MNNPLPSEIRQFIAQQIESVAQLETLLLLRRESQRSWDAEALARQLYLSENTCGLMLRDLERRQFVSQTSDGVSFIYNCVNDHADALLNALAHLYAERRVAVISEIHSRPVSNVQTFADAFRIRKEGAP